MYKTVRHGENSLQYTILPQTEEVLNNSGLKGKGRDYSPSIKVRRSKKKSAFKYVILIIFGVLITLSISIIPMFVMSSILYAHTIEQDHYEAVTVPASSGQELVKSHNKKDLKVLLEMVSTLTTKAELSSSDTSSIATTTLSTVVPKDTVTSPPWTMAAAKSLESSTTPTTIQTISNGEVSDRHITTDTSNHLLQNDPSIKPWDKDIIIRPEVTTSPDNSRSFVPTEKSLAPSTKLFDDVLITTKIPISSSPATEELMTTMGSNLKDAIFAMDDDDETLEVDDVFSLPSSKPDPSDTNSIPDEVTIARWPFVDVSSYFPWAGYSVGDNLLLPLLMAALSSIALVLLLLLAVKRRKRSHAASSQIGKLTADLQADDNTKLLTTDNVDEAEE